MTVAATLRRGAYHDSVVLLALQRGLLERPGVADAAAVMATPANLALLAGLGLLPAELGAARPEDLLIAVRAADPADADAALAAVDELLAAPRQAAGGAGYRPHSLERALAVQPATTWVAISVPGRHAPPLARAALDAGRHVFLFSDNVGLDDERDLKTRAAARGLLLMGPDCGTAIVDGAGLGFANRIPRGPVGIVAASGTGAQYVASGLAAHGVGVSHLLGTGGRDLSATVGGATALAGLAAFAADPDSRVIVIVGKPPAPEVASRLLAAAAATGKPTVIALLGYPVPVERLGNLWFARGLDEAVALGAALAAEIGTGPVEGEVAVVPQPVDSTPSPIQSAPTATSSPRLLRGLFAGGTLAEECLLALRPLLAPLHANVALPGVLPLDDASASTAHTVVDLGDDAFTVGRLHPMIDPALRLQRLTAAAAEPAVGAILLDVVLGTGGEDDPAARLAPAITEAIAGAAAHGRSLAVIVLLVGSEGDPQDLAVQHERLAAAGATVTRTIADAAAAVVGALAPAAALPAAPRPLGPVAVVNVGLASFAAALVAQGVPTLDLDWRPPAGGDARLAGLLARLGRPTAARDDAAWPS